MKLVTDNPYRTLGLLVGTTLREQTRQINKLKMFVEAEQEIDFDKYSFPTLGKLKRNLDTINLSENQLNLNSDKLEAALFWFYDGYTTDLPALECLKDGDFEGAKIIWEDLIAKSDVITQRSASAYNNLSTLYLSGVLEDINTNETILEKGISLKINFLECDYINDFIILATAENYKATKKEIQLLFLNQLLFEVEKSGNISLNAFLDILIKLDFSAKEDFLNDFVKKPIEIITRKIEESKSKRKVNKANSIKAANSLLSDTKDSIKQLKYILGGTNIRYNSISDKLAMEIFACGRDYFMHFKETNTDPSDYSIKLFQIAKSYAVGNIVKQQIDENIKVLQVWIDDKHKRDKHKKVEEDFKFIISKIERFQNLSDTVPNAKDLVDSCKPKLANIKSILGSADDFYLKISSAVANNALETLVKAVNRAQESIDVRIGDFTILRSVVRSALSVSESIGSFDLVSSQRSHYSNNHTVLKSIATQLSNYSSSSSSKNTHRTTSTTSSQSDFDFGENAWWILGTIGLVIGAIAGGGEGAFVGSLIGGGIGSKFK